MQDLVLRAERVASHSRGHFLRLCSFCHQAVASAEAPVRGGLLCAHPGALLLEARLRLVTLGRPDLDQRQGPPDRPEGPPHPPRVGRARRGLRNGRFETRAVARVA